MSAPATPSGPPGGPGPAAKLALPRDSPGRLGKAVVVFFRQASPRLLLGALALATTARALQGSWSVRDPLALLAVVALWPVVEWVIHVHLLHFRPRTVLGIRIHPLSARRHGQHHQDPWRFERAFVPVPTILTSLVVLLGAPALLSPPPWVWTLPTTVLLLGLHYEWVHYLCHIRLQPRSPRYRVLVQNHRRHHFKSETHWMGVSMLLGDRLFGTDGDASEVPRSKTVRNLVDDRAA